MMPTNRDNITKVEPATNTTNTTNISYKISKPISNLPGKGTTHRIRQILNFTDEKRWKQFSSRRLELIDKFGLSERKASEQDDNIRQIANMLRTEFGYPMGSINEFEKLVTAAVQSVRRNRKRSKKKLENSVSNSISVSSSNSSICSPVEHKQDLFTTHESSNVRAPSTNSSSINNHNSSYQNKPSLSINVITTNNTTINNNNTGLRSPLLSPPSSVHGKLDTYRIISLPVTSSRSSSCSLSNSITSPISSRRQQSNTLLPNIQNQYMTTLRSLCLELINIKFESSIKFKNISSVNKVPDILLDKLMNKIQNSKTFISFTHQEQNDKWGNLEVLGEMCTKASISFVIEMDSLAKDNFNQNDKFSIDFLKQLSYTLFREIFQYHNIDMFTQIKFLYFIVGAIVKDYGFDSVLFPLNEIIHHLIQNRSKIDNSISNKVQPLLPPINNGLNILSVVSSQVSNSSHFSPEYTHKENLPGVSVFMHNNNSTIPSPTLSSNIILHNSNHAPLPKLIVKESFANGTLPQPIKQRL